MCELPTYVLSAISNFITAAAAVLVTWLFVAKQRAMRLNEQLNQLARIVREADGNQIDRSSGDQNAREELWKNALRDISADVTSGSDRLVRLNAHSKRRLESLADGIQPDLVPRAKAILFGDAKIPSTVTGRERLLERIHEFQKHLGVFSFIEHPWRRTRP